MKMRAGYTLCGRKPTHAPTSTASTSAARLALAYAPGLAPSVSRYA